MTTKRLISLLAVILGFFMMGLSVNGQNKDFTYREMLNQQKLERDELKQTQKEVFNAILERQKDELERSDAYEREKTMIRHKEERQNITNIQTQERQHQLDLQAEERKKFLSNNPVSLNNPNPLFRLY